MRVFYPVSETLGILVCERDRDPPFGEAPFIRSLMKAGAKAGLSVCAFDPRSWSKTDHTVKGWIWKDGRGWLISRIALPALLYDRSWPVTPEERKRYRSALRGISLNRHLNYLNGKLPGKAGVHAVLAGDGAGGIAGILPPTETYSGPASFASWLERQGGSVFLKPDCGSQGRGVAACTRMDGGAVRVSGRRNDNRPFNVTFRSGQEAAKRLDRWIGSRAYVMQPLLALTRPDGIPFDVRALMQKNGAGRWSLTGAAVRSGRSGTVTANLHGGGSAAPADSKLAEIYGESRAQSLIGQIVHHSRSVVGQIERHFGRFAELGLDFGVDRSGRLWFLEANSKPGRAAMAAVGAEAASAAAERPIAYARSILLRPPGRVIHEFDHL